MFLSQQRLEISGGPMMGPALEGAPFHEEAIGQAAKHAENPDAVVTLNTATVVVIGDVQTLV